MVEWSFRTCFGPVLMPNNGNKASKPDTYGENLELPLVIFFSCQ